MLWLRSGCDALQFDAHVTVAVRPPRLPQRLPTHSLALPPSLIEIEAVGLMSSTAPA